MSETVVVIPVSPVKVKVSVRSATPSVPLSPAILRVVARETVDAAVTRPFAFTVSTGIVVVDPNVPTLPLTVARVRAADTAAVPLTAESVAVASPVRLRLRGVAHCVAVAALPVKAPTKEVDVIEVAPVTTPASTLIVPSRTIADPAAGVRLSAPVEAEIVLALTFILSTCKAVRVPTEVIAV